MGKIDITEARVKNVMKGIPKDSLSKGPKMRQTLKNTFSGMKTILNQLKIRNELSKTSRIIIQRKKRQRLVSYAVAGSIILLVLIALLLVILLA